MQTTLFTESQRLSAVNPIHKVYHIYLPHELQLKSTYYNPIASVT